MSSKSRGFELWQNVFKGAKYIVAPMVDQSELPWRMLSRRYGAELCYTPMLHAAQFKKDQRYRKNNFVVCEEDRPLVVQFCANNSETLLAAAKFVAPYCDAVDINLGCPQAIAKKGHYGAFLQEDWDLIASMVSLLDKELSVPVTCKIRVFEDVEKTVRYAKMLEGAGCQLLTVHGRTREQRGVQTGLASWDHIKAVRENVSIPVFANGNIQFLEDIERCLLDTGVQGVMSAETHLSNPALFAGEHPPCWQVSEEYLSLARQFPCAMSAIRGHFFKIWMQVLKVPEFMCLREEIGGAKVIEDFERVCAKLKSLLLAKLSEEELTAPYTRDSIPFWRCQPYVRPNRGIVPAAARSAELVAREEEKRKARKRRAAENKASQSPSKKKRWFTCDSCNANSKGLKCVHSMCKICCRLKCLSEGASCSGHKFTARMKGGQSGGQLDGGQRSAANPLRGVPVEKPTSTEEELGTGSTETALGTTVTTESPVEVCAVLEDEVTARTSVT